jgi:hypothetical protein
MSTSPQQPTESTPQLTEPSPTVAALADEGCCKPETYSTSALISRFLDICTADKERFARQMLSDHSIDYHVQMITCKLLEKINVAIQPMVTRVITSTILHLIALYTTKCNGGKMPCEQQSPVEDKACNSEEVKSLDNAANLLPDSIDVLLAEFLDMHTADKMKFGERMLNTRCLNDHILRTVTLSLFYINESIRRRVTVKVTDTVLNHIMNHIWEHNKDNGLRPVNCPEKLYEEIMAMQNNSRGDDTDDSDSAGDDVGSNSGDAAGSQPSSSSESDSSNDDAPEPFADVASESDDELIRAQQAQKKRLQLIITRGRGRSSTRKHDCHC